ncbi:MAG: hypothetical protein AABX51_04750 [Nanoarchaeota archaeon]
MKEDVIVSIRMPKKLQEDLKKLAQERRFMDVSEAVRSIVRSRWVESTKLGTTKLQAVRDELTIEKQKRRRELFTRQIGRLSQELKKLGEEIEEY